MANRFERWSAYDPLCDARFEPTTQFQYFLQRMLEDIEGAFDDVDSVLADLTQAQADITAAQADIVDAQADIVTAQGDIADNVTDIGNAQADIIANQNNIIDGLRLIIRNQSWIQGTNILSAADVGSDATITIANHTRVFGNGSTLAITGGTITGRAFSTAYAIYYDDAGWFDTVALDVAAGADTTPSFVSTTNGANAQFTAAANRFFVGNITTPADGGGGTGGGTVEPPGGGGPYP